MSGTSSPRFTYANGRTPALRRISFVFVSPGYPVSNQSNPACAIASAGTLPHAQPPKDGVGDPSPRNAPADALELPGAVGPTEHDAGSVVHDGRSPLPPQAASRGTSDSTVVRRAERAVTGRLLRSGYRHLNERPADRISYEYACKGVRCAQGTTLTHAWLHSERVPTSRSPARFFSALSARSAHARLRHVRADARQVGRLVHGRFHARVEIGSSTRGRTARRRAPAYSGVGTTSHGNGSGGGRAGAPRAGSGGGRCASEGREEAGTTVGP